MNISLESLVAYGPIVADYAVRVAGALVLLIVALILAARLKTISINAMTRAGLDATLTKFFGNLVRWSIVAAAVVSILGMVGIETASFAALIAAAGLAIGLAFQGTLANLASGVMLLIFRPFRIGQFISVAGVSGTVYEIEIFSTTIDTVDNRRIILPNSSVFGSTIENVSHHATRRVDIAVGVSYGASVEGVRECLLSAVARTDSILDDPKPAAVLTGLGASSVDWSVRVWVKSEDYWSVREELIAHIKEALEAREIAIPYPQLDVNLSGLPGLPSGDGIASRSGVLTSSH